MVEKTEQAIAQITDVPEKEETRLAPPISAGSRDEVETLKTADVNIQTQSTCTLASVLNVIREEEEEVEGVEEEEVEEDCLICARRPPPEVVSIFRFSICRPPHPPSSSLLQP